MKKRYYLRAEWEDNWTEVSEKQFINAERAAGFRPKPGCGPVATGGFISGSTLGRVEYSKLTPVESDA